MGQVLEGQWAHPAEKGIESGDCSSCPSISRITESWKGLGLEVLAGVGRGFGAEDKEGARLLSLICHANNHTSSINLSL